MYIFLRLNYCLLWDFNSNHKYITDWSLWIWSGIAVSGEEKKTGQGETGSNGRPQIEAWETQVSHQEAGDVITDAWQYVCGSGPGEFWNVLALMHFLGQKPSLLDSFAINKQLFFSDNIWDTTSS